MSFLTARSFSYVRNSAREAADVVVHEAESVAVFLSREASELGHAVRTLESKVDIIKQQLEEPRAEERSRHFIIDSYWFQLFIASATVANCFQMGLAVDYPEWTLAWLICENVFTTIFVTEMVLKLCVMKTRYCTDKANLLDALLVVLSILDCWIFPAVAGMGATDLQSLSVLRVLRLMRLARILRIFRKCKQLVLVLRGILKAMSATFYISVVCFIIIYIFAIFCTEYLGKSNTHLYPGFSLEDEDIDKQGIMTNYNPHICFGSIFASMFTLFNFAMGSEWIEVARPIAVKQPFFMPVLFLFIIFVGFGVMNTLIAVIVDFVVTESRTLEKAYFESLKHNKEQVLNRMVSLLQSMDKDGDGVLDVEEMAEALNQSGLLRELVESINLPLGWEPTEMIEMLDAKGLGRVSYAEFATVFIRLLDADAFQQICIMESSINGVKKILNDQSQKLESMHSFMKAEIASVKAVVRESSNKQEQVGGERMERLISVGIQGQSTAMPPSASCGNSSEEQSNVVHEGALRAALAAAEDMNLEDEFKERSDQSSSKDIMMYFDASFMSMKASIDRSEDIIAAANKGLHAKLSAIEDKLELQFGKMFHPTSSDNAGPSAGLEALPPLPVVCQPPLSSTDVLQRSFSKNGGNVCVNDSGPQAKSKRALSADVDTVKKTCKCEG